MVDLTKRAEPAVAKLLKCDEDQLYEYLGIWAKAIAEDPSVASSFELHATYDQAAMGIKDEVHEFGRRLFRRWNMEAHKLICGSDTEDKQARQELVKAFGHGDVAIGAALSALLVTNLGLTPAIAAVLAALLVKRFFSPAYEEFCRVWHKTLHEGEQ